MNNHKKISRENFQQICHLEVLHTEQLSILNLYEESMEEIVDDLFDDIG